VKLVSRFVPEFHVTFFLTVDVRYVVGGIGRSPLLIKRRLCKQQVSHIFVDIPDTCVGDPGCCVAIIFFFFFRVDCDKQRQGHLVLWGSGCFTRYERPRENIANMQRRGRGRVVLVLPGTERP